MKNRSTNEESTTSLLMITKNNYNKYKPKYWLEALVIIFILLVISTIPTMVVNYSHTGNIFVTQLEVRDASIEYKRRLIDCWIKDEFSYQKCITVTEIPKINNRPYIDFVK